MTINLNIVVVLEIGSGTFNQGFPVTLRILEEGRMIRQERHCPRIPVAPHIPVLYENWQGKYNKLGHLRKIHPVPKQVTHESMIQGCQSATEELENYLRQWFRHDLFQSLRDRILAQAEVKHDNSVPIVIDVDTGNPEQDTLLRKLPWHLWDLFDQLRHAEVVLNAGFNRPIAPLGQSVKILAIFGSSEGGLELPQDAAELEQLQQKGTEITRLDQPTREALHTCLCSQAWDILFFAGHSSSEEHSRTGYIQIRDDKLLSLDDLREDLRTAIGKGLKLAIFNSCDGLGIANYLAELQVPSMVVMREPVPDVIAREFLKHFLSTFSSGKPLYLAVREARKNLQWRESAEKPCPAASWLPIVCQNPIQPELVWSTASVPVPKRFSKQKIAIGLVAFTGSIVAGLSLIPGLSRQSLTPEPSLSIASHLSLGDKQLLDITTNAKTAGITAFAAGNYAKAIEQFRQSLHDNPNDPETWIYLNNAIAAQDTKANISEGILPIAVSVPVKLDPDIAKEQLRGVAIAQTQINCGIEVLSDAIQNLQTEVQCDGGIAGKRLEVRIADDKGDTGSVVEIATALVDLNPLAVIGHYTSSITQAAVEQVYDNVRLVAISPSSTSVQLSDLSDYLFRTSTNDAIAAQMLADYAQSQGLTQIAVAYVPGDPYSESLRDEFRKHLPSQQFVYECNLLQGGASFNAEACLNNAKASGAQALLLIPHKTDIAERALRIVNSNNGELRLLGGDIMYSARTVTDFGAEAANGGLVVAIPWHRSNSPFEQDAQTLFGDVGVNWRTAMAYDATQAIIAGLTKNPTRTGLRQALSRPDFRADGATGEGTVQFDPQGDRLPGNNIGVLVEVAEETNGTYRFRLVP
ncbi:MAG: ABC transporter substrate-binding protein [Cyanobacteria bacterium CRU_2_1]|nr:ABC transporter substrate-binding protein [Cyanobacteria bacterium RU_5_0]NJR58183.1 ABC transporter substrate-binding protein [Cyanobacteria bacterium CRU_2_1]